MKKKLLGFIGFGAMQLIMFLYTISALVNTDPSNKTRKVVLLVLACTWFLFFCLGVYGAFKAKRR